MANDGGAGAGAGANGSQGAGGTGSGTPPASVTADWTATLGDELKGYVQTKGFKDPGAVVDSYRNLEKLHGVPPERLLKLPEKFEGDDARAVFQRIGMPKEAKDYNVQIPKELGDEKVAERIKEFAFKNNLTNRQVEALVAEEIADYNSRVESAKSQANVASEQLKQKWGAAYEQNKNIAQAGAQAFGITKEHMAALDMALGPAGTMEMLHSLGVKSGESSFVSGTNPGAQTNTPDGAKVKIDALIKDASFNARLKAGDIDAKKQWDQLHLEWAGGKMVTL